MPSLPRTVLLLLLALLWTPAAADAAARDTPAPVGTGVGLQVEGAASTLVAQLVTLAPDAAPVDKDGVACPAASAGGILERATGGRWTTDGTAATSVLGEAHPSGTDPRRWVLAVSSVPTAVSPCAMPVNPGDRVLLFPALAVPEASCRTNGRDGFCGTPDRTAPQTVVRSITEQQRFSRPQAPRVLRGLSVDPSGIADVRLRLTRRIGTSRCAAFDGLEDEFRRLKPCGADRGVFFSIGRAAAWSWELPARLTRGRYTLDVQAVDGLGNVSDELARGRDRVVFTVR